MNRAGDFPQTGLEELQEWTALRKSPVDVVQLLEEVLAAARKLEKRSRTLSVPQLYDLQQHLGKGVGEIQRDIYARIVREGK